jgi:hypothetical protein
MRTKRGLMLGIQRYLSITFNHAHVCNEDRLLLMSLNSTCDKLFGDEWWLFNYQYSKGKVS